jgi:hypothetical protein
VEISGLLGQRTICHFLKLKDAYRNLNKLTMDILQREYLIWNFYWPLAEFIDSLRELKPAESGVKGEYDEFGFCSLTNDLSRAEEGVHNMNIWFGISVGLPTQTTCPPQ